MNSKNLAIFGLIAVAASIGGISVLSNGNLESIQVEDTQELTTDQTNVSIETSIPPASPRAPPTLLEFYGNDKESEVSLGSVARLSENTEDLNLIRTTERSGDVTTFYAPLNVEYDPKTTMMSYLKDGGLMMVHNQYEGEKHSNYLKSKADLGARIVQVQGYPAIAVEGDDFSPTKLKIFIEKKDLAISLLYGGTLEDLQQLAEKVELP